jgi:GxxExxY protein
MALSHEEITYPIIGAAIEVHRNFGPGLLESVYEKCLCQELELRGIEFDNQVLLPIVYKGVPIESDLRMDIVVPGKLIIELKSVEAVHPIHEAQLLTYMKLTGIRLGLLINFNVLVLRDGIHRRIL